MKYAEKFTSTISPELLTWLTTRAKQTKQTRRQLLEEALIKYRKDIKKESMQKGFKRASKDISIVELAEWGMEDYLRIVKNS
jgi:hypothetical protein